MRKVDELYRYMLARQKQQISLPLDKTSRNLLGAVAIDGAGSHGLTQSVGVATTPPSSVTVPAAYAGTVIFDAEGIAYEIPYLQII